MCLNSNIKVWLRRIAPCLLEWFILDEPSIKIIFVPFSCLLLFLSLLLLILYLQKWKLKVILKTTKYSIKKCIFKLHIIVYWRGGSIPAATPLSQDTSSLSQCYQCFGKHLRITIENLCESAFICSSHCMTH